MSACLDDVDDDDGVEEEVPALAVAGVEEVEDVDVEEEEADAECWSNSSITSGFS